MSDKKVAIVTGGNTGIGLAITQNLILNDYTLIATYIDNKPNSDLERKYLQDQLDLYPLDITQRDECEKFATYVKNKYENIYLLVNNAGIMPSASLRNLTYEQIDATLDVNLKGVFNITKNLLELIQESGRIINISSIAGIYGQFGISHYSASKAGVIGFTKSLAKETARKKITVNAIAPGMVETDMTRGIDQKAQEEILKQIPLGEYAKPEDIANAVKFLASQDARYITRHVLNVDGGLTF